ncbi:MAG: sulfite exporter TauE/SafE family protein [Phormidesmis sp.]
MALSVLIMLFAGLISGVLAGFLGIGGGTLLVPTLEQLNISGVHATATSSLAILVISSIGSFQNWRMGYVQPRPIFLLGMPAAAITLLVAWVGNDIPAYLRQGGFGLLLLTTLYLVSLKRKVIRQAQFRESRTATGPAINPVTARLFTGTLAGCMAGLFGVGGGVILVPMQILLLGEQIKTAVRTSLGVIVLTSIAACVGNAIHNNIEWIPGLVLGLGGLVGVQISTRFLPKLSDNTVTQLFRGLLVVLSLYMFWKAWLSFTA